MDERQRRMLASLVAGSALFKTKRPRSVMAAMREAGREHPFIG